jgi:hypothetical protein
MSAIPDDTKAHIYFNPKYKHGLNYLFFPIEQSGQFEITNWNTSEQSKYDKLSDLILKQLENGKFCSNVIFEFAKKVMENSHIMMLLRGENKKTVPYGFAVLNLEYDTMTISLMCAKNGTTGAGKFMMSKIKEMTSVLDMKQIQLNSVTTAVPFYAKMGFRCNPVCPMAINLKEEDDSPASRKSPKSRRSLSKSRGGTRRHKKG